MPGEASRSRPRRHGERLKSQPALGGASEGNCHHRKSFESIQHPLVTLVWLSQLYLGFAKPNYRIVPATACRHASGARAPTKEL